MIKQMRPVDGAVLQQLCAWVSDADGVRIVGKTDDALSTAEIAARLQRPETEVQTILNRLLRAGALASVNHGELWYVNPTLTDAQDPWWYRMFGEPIPPRARDQAPRVYRHGRCLALVRRVRDLARPGTPRRRRMRLIHEA